MKAVVLEKPCRAEDLMIQEVPVPSVQPGWVLVHVKAFGINRSEIYTRQGYSETVPLPRIIGIECVGEIADASDSSFTAGDRVVSLMGGLGREFDGSYAEYALIPTAQVYPVHTRQPWEELAAIPEMYYTAYGALFETLNLSKDDTLLIRGGTSSVGLAALQLAKSIGVTVVSTTRESRKKETLFQHGADKVLVDDQHIETTLYEAFPHGVTKILELIGTKTIKQSLRMLSRKGVLCMAGMLGNEWIMERFEPMIDIPSTRYLTQFDSGEEVEAQILVNLLNHIEKHSIQPPIAQVFALEDIAQAHMLMEKNTANGKIIVKTSE